MLGVWLLFFPFFFFPKLSPSLVLWFVYIATFTVLTSIYTNCTQGKVLGFKKIKC